VEISRFEVRGLRFGVRGSEFEVRGWGFRLPLWRGLGGGFVGLSGLFLAKNATKKNAKGAAKSRVAVEVW